MQRHSLWTGLFAGWFLLAGTAGMTPAADAGRKDPPKTKILVVAGPSTHPPGTHEAAGGGRLLAYCIGHAENIGPLDAQFFQGWPQDQRVLENAASIVFIGDIFPPERMDQPKKIMAQLAKLMDRGCGIVCVHYATGLRREHVSEDGDHPLLKWLGGYFATGGCVHHKSVARVCPATLVPEDNHHPILRGWKSFSFDDEPYWNNYFGKDGMAKNVTPLVYAMLPPEKPKKEIVAWAVQRTDGGRGVGIVVPHYFKNWRINDLRMLVLNSIAWTAKIDVPAEGVKSSLPDLATFHPASVEPRPRVKKK